MAAPSFIQEAETVWDTITDKTTASFSVLAGDVLVAVALAEGNASPPFTASGGSLTWTKKQEIDVVNYCGVAVWSAIVDTNKSMTVTVADTGESRFGINVFTFRGSDGVGASAKTNVASGAPTLNITTTQANSAIVVANADWNAADGTSRTWRANAGALTEQSYYRDAAVYTVYVGYHADAGAIATYAVGLSAPTGQKYSIVALEVKGTAAAPPVFVPPDFFERKNPGLRM